MRNKRKIDEYIPKAIESLSKNIAKNGKIKNGFSGQIATFAVAVSTGSLLSAVAFFSEDDNKSEVERVELMNIIYEIIEKEEINEKNEENKKNKKLLFYVERQYKEKSLLEYRRFQQDILNAAIAIKLAINFFSKVTDDEKSQN